MKRTDMERWVKIAWLFTTYSTTIAISSFRYETSPPRYAHVRDLIPPPFPSANYDHYTWWSIASFSVYALLGLGDVEQLYFWLIVGIQIQVVLGKSITLYK